MDVIPSFLDIQGQPTRFGKSSAFGNVELRSGEVQEIFYPDHELNKSKKFIEYRVFVQHMANGVGVGKTYDYCVLLNPLAGLADQASWTLRADKSAERVSKSGAKPGKGSKVLILCINGTQNNPIIIGGLRDDSEKDTNKGHNFHLNFNGVDVVVNKDGELILTYAGATEIDGTTKADSNVVGTTIRLEKDGSVVASTGDGAQILKVDRTGQQIQLGANEGVNLGETQGSGSDYMVKGTTYRQAETQEHQAMIAALNGAAAAATAASVSGGAAITGLATAITAVGPPQAVALAAVAIAGPAFLAAMGAVSAQLAAVAAAIQAFEATTDTYLSKKHRND